MAWKHLIRSNYSYRPDLPDPCSSITSTSPTCESEDLTSIYTAATSQGDHHEWTFPWANQRPRKNDHSQRTNEQVTSTQMKDKHHYSPNPSDMKPNHHDNYHGDSLPSHSNSHQQNRTDKQRSKMKMDVKQNGTHEGTNKQTNKSDKLSHPPKLVQEIRLVPNQNKSLLTM